MSSLNWSAFKAMAGSESNNFESLCRSLTWRNYSKYGRFAARANQPGVEFHLDLYSDCSLGDRDRWFGWQCRRWDLDAGVPIGATRRTKITASIEKSLEELEGLTDWVLWTRRTLTNKDQKWFYALDYPLQLHLWDERHVVDHLSGSSEVLRATYFGDLVLTADTLERLHQEAAAAVPSKWMPDVHQPVDAERDVRKLLAFPGAWTDLGDLAGEISSLVHQVEADSDPVSPTLAQDIRTAEAECGFLVDALRQAESNINAGRFNTLSVGPSETLLKPAGFVGRLARRLRSARNRRALAVTNLASRMRVAAHVLSSIEAQLATPLVAVVADAGNGKTHLAAELTKADSGSPGILLHGGRLRSTANIDELAQRLVVNGKRVETFVHLIEAASAVGEREGRRVPIVIDALNEAEDPRLWKTSIASLLPTLERTPHVLLVVTLREESVDEALPDGVRRIIVNGFGLDTPAAIEQYLAYYKIDASDTALPYSFLSHPLTLRIFCEATNSNRETMVPAPAVPSSVTEVFDRYIVYSASRIAELSSILNRYFVADVKTALADMGLQLWLTKQRDIPMRDLRKLLSDESRPWDRSLVRALEQEGLIVRTNQLEGGNYRFGFPYDSMAGHVIADALIARGLYENDDGRSVSNVQQIWSKEDLEGQPLGSDVLFSLAMLMPRRLYGAQLWKRCDADLRDSSISAAAWLESQHLDKDSVKEIGRMVLAPRKGPDLLSRLRSTRGIPGHSLNAEFLDELLRSLSVAERDRRWTEWLRRHREDALKDLERLGNEWKTRLNRSDGDSLRAKWVMWTLTSTIKRVRDQATQCLYWFGLHAPARLFDLVGEALHLNDPYVSERVVAAAYGVVTSRQRNDESFISDLEPLLCRLAGALIEPEASHASSSWLLRDHVAGIIEFARRFFPSALPQSLSPGRSFYFSREPGVPMDSITARRRNSVSSTLRMDFDNYTIGRLFSDRRNYDTEHEEHQKAVAHVLQTVWNLGWRKDTLGQVDNDIEQTSSRRWESLPAERYGKKYSRIGFWQYAGHLDDDALLDTSTERLSDVPIDPTFPEIPERLDFQMPTWSRPTPRDDRRWIREGVVKLPDAFLSREKILGERGPWVAVEGYLETQDQTPGRRVFGLIRGVLADAAESASVEDALRGADSPGRSWIPEAPSDYYTYAGEIPWNPRFAAEARRYEGDRLYRAFLGEDDDLDVENLAHEYGWEGHHSPLNTAGGALVPSQRFSNFHNLRGAPQTFDQFDVDGMRASMSLSAPEGYNGHILYLRTDLVESYASGRALIWIVWGERQLYGRSIGRSPRWLRAAQQQRADVWRVVRTHAELSA